MDAIIDGIIAIIMFVITLIFDIIIYIIEFILESLIPNLAMRIFFLSEYIAYYIGYYTARLFIPIVTLNQIKVQIIKSNGNGYPQWNKLNKKALEQFILDGEVAAILGMIFWIFIIVGVVIGNY